MKQPQVVFTEDLSKTDVLKILDAYKVQIQDVLAKTDEAVSKMQVSLEKAKVNKLILENQKKLLLDIEVKLNEITHAKGNVPTTGA